MRGIVELKDKPTTQNSLLITEKFHPRVAPLLNTRRLRIRDTSVREHFRLHKNNKT
jgi:hypothetical protein